MHFGKRLLSGGLTATAALVCAVTASAQATYQVTIQAPASATTLPGGTLEFSFAGGGDARAATATLSGLTYSADYAHGSYTVFGTATAPAGATAGTISNDTSQFTNGFFTTAAPFGSRLVFTLTLSGLALLPTAPYAATGSDFAVQLFDTVGNALWTPDPQGRVLDIPLNPDGSLGPVQYFGSTVASVVATPEPSARAGVGTGAVGLFCLAVARRRHGRRSEVRS